MPTELNPKVLSKSIYINMSSNDNDTDDTISFTLDSLTSSEVDLNEIQDIEATGHSIELGDVVAPTGTNRETPSHPYPPEPERDAERVAAINTRIQALTVYNEHLRSNLESLTRMTAEKISQVETRMRNLWKYIKALLQHVQRLETRGSPSDVERERTVKIKLESDHIRRILKTSLEQLERSDSVRSDSSVQPDSDE